MAGSTLRRQNAMRGLGDESGQVMVLTVLCMTVLLGFIAFAVDIGILLRAQRNMQIAADSAAIAAASQMPSGIWANINNAAITDAALNGVINDGTNGTVTVNSPTGPLSGPFATNNHYVEVIVSQKQPTFFMRLFGQTKIPVSARAVATTISTQNCIYGLGVGGITVTNASLNAPTCGILDNGLLQAPGTDSVDVASAGIVNLLANLTNAAALPASALVQSLTTVTDPLSGLGLPPAAGCMADPKSGVPVQPSAPDQIVCYNGLTLSSGNITLNPGTYVINGNGSSINPLSLKISGSTTVTGTGVTFIFLNGASLDSTGNTASVNLSAPTSGSYAGYLFVQDPTDTTVMQLELNSNWILDGVIYLPGSDSELSLTQQSGPATMTVDLVVGILSLGSLTSSTGVVSIKPYEALGPSSPIVVPRLAE